MGSVLCVWRCAGVRRARAVRVCVLDARARLRVLRARRRCVLCAVYSVVRLFVQLGGAALAGRAARRAAACCGWSRACLMVYGGRAARPTGSSAAQGASMRSALHVRLLRGWRVCFRAVRDARMCSRCGRGRARGAAWSHRGPTSVGLRRDEGGRAKRPCRHRVAAKEKDFSITIGVGAPTCNSW